jgi:tetraacyldisaccharide 4'-kinase
MKAYLKNVIEGKTNGAAAMLVRPLLLLVSFLYIGIVGARSFLFERGVLRIYKSETPVISVGNIIAGGAGKTPLVLFLAKYLRAKGRRPVVLTRGYMGAATGAVPSDEAEMMRELLGDVPVLVGPDREGLMCSDGELLKADVFLMDDAFQHRQVARDLDIVVVDAADPFGNGLVLPAGLLREPLKALRRADMIVLTRCDTRGADIPALRSRLERFCPGIPVIETVHQPVGMRDLFDGQGHGPGSLKQGPVAAICAIGSPTSFQEGLKVLGADISFFRSFEDHHVFTVADISSVVGGCKERGITKLVTTHKDAVKLGRFKDVLKELSVLVLDIEIRIVHGETEFLTSIDRAVRS